jgi:hypothetical protein
VDGAEAEEVQRGMVQGEEDGEDIIVACESRGLVGGRSRGEGWCGRPFYGILPGSQSSQRGIGGEGVIENGYGTVKKSWVERWRCVREGDGRWGYGVRV